MSLPLSLYVHFPWCVRKCPYCDFNSHESKGELPTDDYIEALLADLDRDLATFEMDASMTLGSIFMGGGTPSLFSGDAISKLMERLNQRLTLLEETEVTIEANPGTVDVNNFAAYRAAGLNRLSLGVQSFGNSQLEALGRIHTSNEASAAYHTARDAGFENINIDLMHGLPQQNIDGALQDLRTAISLGPEHISWYQLTIEPNTVFYNQPPTLPQDDDLWEIYQQGSELLAAEGYVRYEVSAFARDGKQSKHNLNYWQFGDYLGIGAGAHGKITHGESDQLLITRTNKTRLPSDYLKGQKSKQSTVPDSEQLLEFLMNSLRLLDGFDVAHFKLRTNVSLEQLEQFYIEAEKRKFLYRIGNRIKPTELGLQYLNDLLLIAAET